MYFILLRRLSFFVQTWFKTESGHLLGALVHAVYFLEVDEHEKLAGRIGVDVLESARLDVLNELAHIVKTRFDLGDFQKATVSKKE